MFDIFKMKAVGSRAQVMHGTAHHTAGGLTKKDFVKSGDRYVSKVKAEQESSNPWIAATQEAREKLDMQHKFVTINKGPAGKKLYKAAKKIYASM